MEEMDSYKLSSDFHSCYDRCALHPLTPTQINALKNKAQNYDLGMLGHIYNTSTQKVEAIDQKFILLFSKEKKGPCWFVSYIEI